jgi:hypothetical protein
MDTKLEALCFIKDQMLMNKEVDARTILNATKLAENDEYLYDLINDWMRVTDTGIKALLLDDIITYTEEIKRKHDSF